MVCGPGFKLDVRFEISAFGRPFGFGLGLEGVPLGATNDAYRCTEAIVGSVSLRGKLITHAVSVCDAGAVLGTLAGGVAFGDGQVLIASDRIFLLASLSNPVTNRMTSVRLVGAPPLS